MTLAVVLTLAELENISLPGWAVTPERLERTFKAPEFLVAIELVYKAARVMEEMDHHADVDIRWRSVVVRLSTHKPLGITNLDVEQAKRWNELAASLNCE